MKEKIDSLCNHYFVRDNILHKKTQLRGRIVEMVPLDKAKILWETGEEEWLMIYRGKGYNEGAIENVAKILK